MSASGERLAPVAPGERIEALDVVRGFALIGVFLMNIEFFNRSIVGIEEGMPSDLTGVDWFASWFIAYFVQGKFWTIFSMLFGMGFAVMLTRAERGQRAFLVPYLRRILALAVFGSLHFIFLWSGDILFSYAAGAAGLLVLLYARWWMVLIAVVILGGLAIVLGTGALGRVAGSLAFIGLLAIYMRSEKKIFARIPLFAFIYTVLGILGAIAATLLWVLPGAPEGPRMPVTVITCVMLVVAFLSGRYHQPRELRGLRLGVCLYALPALVMIGVGTVRYLSPPQPAGPAVVASVLRISPAMMPAGGVTDERAKRIAEVEERKRNEERVLSSGAYAEVVDMRAGEFPAQAANDAGFAVIVIGMFLIGVWFVRSGIMENVDGHMRLFRRLAAYGLPIGIGLGLVGSLLATSHKAGTPDDGFQLARGLAMLGSLPACLGYVGLVVVALRSNTVFAKVRVLGAVGRMGLTNYLTQSVVSTFVFYGYAGGQWGLSRAWQVVFVAAVFTLQVLLSHWWLARFRYGPMEWLWRAFTYRTIPPMRLAPASDAPSTPAMSEA